MATDSQTGGVSWGDRFLSSDLLKALQPYSRLFLLALALLVRLYNLQSPIIGVHSWRQADTAALARNFYENGLNFFYPQVDWGETRLAMPKLSFPFTPTR
ncbi:MAG: hypothetical protein HC886_16055 [Leptolyngbyaceae cyanobacterium SM1_1_3]|nr:hypothetical protein [Leptolyngbyaceae cyanobacterium SM1_1_3]